MVNSPEQPQWYKHALPAVDNNFQGEVCAVVDGRTLVAMGWDNTLPWHDHQAGAANE